ncbi:MAG TPA: translation elongation factor Ts [Actinobacteria bacterium]|nr:translation elongation factor Ts [Actinomycetota bacterium]
MAEITAAQVAELRKASGAGMMDAKRALEEAAGDLARAADILREKGLASAKKRSERATDQGTIGHYLHFQADRPVIGVLVELSSETDFVAKSDGFQTAARDIAMHVAAARPRWVRRDEVPEAILTKERELIAAQARHEGKPEKVIEKIVDGRVDSFYEDNVLYDQTFVNPEKYEGTVGQMVEMLAATMGENISVRRFARVGVGEVVE